MNRISPAALLLVVIVSIIGFVWWMNKYGAGGPSQADKTPIAPAERPILSAPALLKAHQEQQRKQEAIQRSIQNAPAPVLTYDQMRANSRR